MTELSTTFERLSMNHDLISPSSSSPIHRHASSSSPSSSSSNNNQSSRLTTSASTSEHLSIPEMRKQRSQRFTVPTSHSESSLASSSNLAPSPSTSTPLAFHPTPAPVQAQSIPLSYHALHDLNGPAAPPVQRSLSEDSFTHGLPYSEARYQSHSISNASNPMPNGNGNANGNGGHYASMPHYQHQQMNQQQQSSLPRSNNYDFGGPPLSDYQNQSNNGGAMAPRSFAGNQQSHDFVGSRPDPSLDWLSRPPPNSNQYQGMGPPGMTFEGASGQSFNPMMNRNPPDDEVIPTAIVIKNIPFQVPKEQLLGVMEDLRLPAPFAFNYHFDNGQFRGLAFANFRNASDASLCVSALNGFDLQGRKLRTEFKKVLKEGEKEKIEREKALKRMRSARELGTGMMDGPPVNWNRREASAPGGVGSHASYGSVAPINTDDDDYGRPVQGAYSSTLATLPSMRSFGSREYVQAPPTTQSTGDAVWAAFNPGGGSGTTVSSSNTTNPSSGPYSASPPSDVGTSISARMVHTSSSGSESGGARSGDSAPIELDMNDSQTLDIYSRVVVFKDDFLREELAFARSLSPTQRRIVHLVAKKLELGHRSVGAGDDRHVVVFKASAADSPSVPRGIPSTRALRHSASTLARQPSRDALNSYLHSNPSSFQHSTTNYGLPSSTSSTSSGPMGAFMKPSLSASSLQSKKSMPDIRSNNGRRSNMNLRDGYQSLNAVSNRTSNRNYGSVQNMFDAPPPVPSVPREYYDSGSSSSPNPNGMSDPSPTSEEGGSTSTGATSSIGNTHDGFKDTTSNFGANAWRRGNETLSHN